MQTKIEKHATQIAHRIEWDCDKAMQYAMAILTECNMHTEAAALQTAYDQKMKDDEALWVNLETQEYQDYSDSFVAQGFVPMTFAEWQKAKINQMETTGAPAYWN